MLDKVVFSCYNESMCSILDKAIRRVPNFPKHGILFYDITSVLTNPEACGYCIDSMEKMYRNSKIDAIAAVESRGFVFASPLADRLKLPLVLIRKKGKLPGAVYSEEYSLEYGTSTVEMQKCDIQEGMNVLVIDDLIATGGTLKAVKRLVETAGGKVIGFFGVIGLPFLNYKQELAPVEVQTLINFDSE